MPDQLGFHLMMLISNGSSSESVQLSAALSLFFIGLSHFMGENTFHADLALLDLGKLV